jgi:hypothetical protein
MKTADLGALERWKSIPGLVHGLVDGLSEEGLDRRRRKAALSPRELVHHVAEANVVAASIVTAALGSPGCVFDWSWMLPFGAWMERMRYDRKPIGPSLRMLEALNAYIVAQLEPLPDGLAREVRLRDEPDGQLRTVTVRALLLQEVEHAREHVEEAGPRRRPRRAARR